MNTMAKIIQIKLRYCGKIHLFAAIFAMRIISRRSKNGQDAEVQRSRRYKLDPCSSGCPTGQPPASIRHPTLVYAFGGKSSKDRPPITVKHVPMLRSGEHGSDQASQSIVCA